MMRALLSKRDLELPPAEAAPDDATPAELFGRALSAHFGDDRRFSLEHRLFNTISLLNAAANIIGALGMLNLAGGKFLVLLQTGTGLLFLACYFLSRFRNLFRALYWPFVLLTLGFVFTNALQNAGTTGGAHYYLIPALVIAVILSDRTRTTIAAVCLFVAATAALLAVEQYAPAWVVPYADARERLFDLTANLPFVQVFTGALVLV